MAMAPDELRSAVRQAIDPLHEDAVAYTPEGVAIAVLAAIPDGWARVDGGWVQLEQTYEDAIHDRPIYRKVGT